MYQEIMCNFENIVEAYKLAHRSKTDAPEVIEFDKNKMHNLNCILCNLQKKAWDKIFIYYRFTIYEPKERIVDAMTFEGRIVQHILCDKILRPYFEPRLIKENCACRVNKGTDYALNLLKQGIVQFRKTHTDGYVLKMDVKKYFPSVDRTVLKKMISYFPDKEILDLLYYIIDTSPDENGIPIGNQSSQWFALYYLDKVDRIIKEKYRIQYYTRYMDDLIILHESKSYLTALLNEIKIFANDFLKLNFNQKTQISPLHKGVTFLGWRFIPTKTGGVYMRVDSGKRNLRLKVIRNIHTDYINGHIDEKKYNERLQSVRVNLSKGNTHQFQERYIKPP